MATIRAVVNFRVKPGRYADLFEALRTVKKIAERLGDSLTVNRVAAGAEATHIFAVVQYADWAAYAKAASDSEVVAFLEAARNNPNPPWDAISSTIVEEVAL